MTNLNGGELGIDALVQPEATVAPLQFWLSTKNNATRLTSPQKLSLQANCRTQSKIAYVYEVDLKVSFKPST